MVPFLLLLGARLVARLAEVVVVPVEGLPALPAHGAHAALVACDTVVHLWRSWSPVNFVQGDIICGGRDTPQSRGIPQVLPACSAQRCPRCPATLRPRAPVRQRDSTNLCAQGLGTHQSAGEIWFVATIIRWRRHGFVNRWRRRCRRCRRCSHVQRSCPRLDAAVTDSCWCWLNLAQHKP